MTEYCSNPMCRLEATGRSILDQKLYCGKYCQPSPLIGYRNPETDTLHCDSPGCLNDVIGQIGLSDYCLEHLTEEAARRKRQREVSPDRRLSPPTATPKTSSRPPAATPKTPRPPAATQATSLPDVPDIEARKQASEAVQKMHTRFLEEEATRQADENRRIEDARQRYSELEDALNVANEVPSACTSCENGFAEDGAYCSVCELGKARAAAGLAKDKLDQTVQTVETMRRIRRDRHARRTRLVYESAYRTAGGKQEVKFVQ